jgi:phage protein D/phage baseplate assembly protein gpV
MPASTPAPQVNQIQIKINGTQISEKLSDALFEVEVETSLYLPSMFIFRFHDEKLEFVDDASIAAGKSVEILLPALKTPNTMVTVFKGEITAIEPEYTEDFLATLVVRGYDKGHRLHRGTKTKVFIQSTDSDIVKKIAGESGLSVQADATTQVFDHVFQYGVSDWTFIHERARRNGYEVTVDDAKLYFRKPSTTQATATLEWGVSMLSFQPRMSLTKQVNTVKVKGWDPLQKKAILGQATTSSSSPSVGVGGWGGSLSQSAFSGTAEVLEVRQPVHSQAEANTIAQAILDQINAGFLEAEGLAYGDPALKPGAKVSITKVGTKFSGSYVVTTARHMYSAEDGYKTQFTVQGARAQTMADLIDQSISEQRTSQLWGGVVVGLVTNNNDPNNTGRVKVKFPWLDDALESNWAPITAVGAGKSYGFMWLPEINDEVLVAFEHGDFDYPYVVGSVWNGQDKPPEQASAAVANGKVVVRTLKTTAGHIIRLTEKSGDKKIEIIDSTTQTQITLDETNKKITIKSTGDIELNATGKMDIKAAQDITMSSSGGNVKIEGLQVSVNGKTSVEVKSNGTGTVQSTGPLTVKGAVVNIN